MSDPIRSISQNNYLLAAQQEVSHDNTLSGNGTEASPLGLNETVLYQYSGSGHGEAGNVILSESRSNFEFVRIIFRQNDGHNECKDVYNVDDNSNLTLNSFTLFNNYPINKISKYTISGTSITFVEGGEYTISGFGSGQRLSILKVVGINRIANN